MKTKFTSLIFAGLTLSAPLTLLAGAGPDYWARVRAAESGRAVQPAPKAVYTCSQCQAQPVEHGPGSATAMDHCKENATVTCPACREVVAVSVQGTPKNRWLHRDVTYTNAKGQPCVFVAKGSGQ